MESKTCLSTGEQSSALEYLKINIRNYLLNITKLSECGDGLWYRVAYLNMNDSSQHCPSAWSEYTSNGVRVCSRPSSLLFCIVL